MRIAIIGSRSIKEYDISKYVSEGDEIVSGGAVGVDACAADHAKENGIKMTVFLPQYDKYGRAAPIIRNRKIVDYADKVIAVWDGSSRGTLSVIKYTKLKGKECQLIICEQNDK
jgi:hypothetical protein